MADIFISYSSKDRAQAEQLVELLGSAGLSVWIDKQGIDVATSWSGEIVDAIDGCKAMVVLLSPSSVESVNVIREVALASERKKKILPLNLEPVSLTRDLAYHLAGLQRAPMTNIDAIIRALGKLGLEATGAPQPPKIVREADDRKSLMILPFEDLSPTADNQWFADGIVSELINVLSNVKALRTMDAQTTKEFKHYKGHLTLYAKEMGVRYFVQGDVRKFGDQIKISSRLLDIETGDHLWQDAHKGTMEDIFDIQETVAKKVVEGLDVILTRDEERRLEQKPTENAEAYELWLKGNEYFARHTSADYDRALGLYEEAARLEPRFANAHMQLANTCLEYYRVYSRDSNWLTRASEHINAAESVIGESARIYALRGVLAARLGNGEESLRFAEHAVELDPESDFAYDTLSISNHLLGRHESAVRARQRVIQLRATDRDSHYNYLLELNEFGDPSRLAEAARAALPVYERHLRLSPDDINARVEYAFILRLMGEHERALVEIQKVENTEGLDGKTLYNLACLYFQQGENKSGMRVLWNSVERGYRGIEDFRLDPDLALLQGTPEFETLMKELEEKIAQEQHG